MGLIFFFFNSYPFLHCKFVRHFLNIGWIIKAPPSHPTNFWGGRSPSVPLKSPPLCIIICRSYTINFFYDKAFFSNYFESDAVHLANLSSMEMFDVGPTLGASIVNLSRTEVPWVGSTSGATVANVSNDVFEVGANIVLLSWNSLRELPHSTNVSQDRGSWLFLPARAWDIILASGRERARAKKIFSTYGILVDTRSRLHGWPVILRQGPVVRASHPNRRMDTVTLLVRAN